MVPAFFLSFRGFLDAGSGHHIEVSFVLLEPRRVDLLETEKRDEAQLSGLYALPA